MHERLFLCRPCAERMKSLQTVENLAYGKSRSQKGTCEECGRRRYGALSDVVFREPQTCLLDADWVFLKQL